MKSKDITSKSLHAKFYASRIKTSELEGGKIRPPPRVWSVFKSPGKGGFPLMAKITRILAGNICRQFFFVINTATSTSCLVENFQLICYSQRVNATSQYNDSGSSRCSKWPNDQMIRWLQW